MPKQRFITLLSVFFIVISGFALFAQNPVRIGVVIDGPWERNDEIRQLIQTEILKLTQAEFEIRFPADKLLVADWTREGVRTALDKLLSDPEVDLLLAAGVIASGEISTRQDLPKPVIAPFVIDAELQGLPSREGGSGVRNLNYLSHPARVISDMKFFREIVPFDEVTILLNKEVWDSIPQLTSRIQAALEEMNVAPKLLPIERTIKTALLQLTEETDAVYVAPLFQLSSEDFSRLIKHLNDNRIPSFSLIGRSEVERGLLATATPDMFPKISRRIALNVQRILLGEDAGKLPTAFAVGEQIFINMETAREIQVSPPFSVMTEAVLLNEQREGIERTVNLAGAMREALDKNLDLIAEQRFVAAGKENVNAARSVLLPQIDASTTGLIIDDDRAAASLGSQAERTWIGALSGSQLIFSEKAWANHSIQKNLQEAREQDLQTLRLDIIQAGATAYLNVLRAKTFESVQKENLKRTRSNLELARVREAIGYSGPSEVYRWESQIANARKDVIDANARRNVAEIALNRLLHHPLEEPFITQDADISDPAVAVGEAALLDYFDDILSFKTFRAFMVEAALDWSPELQALDSFIAAKERELQSATRSFFLPTIALQGEVSHLFDEGGAGTETLQGIPNFSLPQADDTNWQIALNASLPIFEGGGRSAERGRAKKELEDLRITRRSAAEKIEQRVRSALHLAGASRAGIQLANDAADAAVKNLNLVTDAYSRGAVDILELLDAQNAALNANLAAANAVYDFLIDIIEVERSSGGFWLFAQPDERQAWWQRLNDFFEKAGAKPEPED